MEDELEIPLDRVVASVGQSHLIRLGGIRSIIVDPPKWLRGPSFSETKACVVRGRGVLS